MALDIAAQEELVDYDVLIAACLLHDIGRQEQNENPALCHAQVGSEKAFRFLINCGWNGCKAKHVRECILTHRFRTEHPPASLEAKILFDADKIDATGALVIARTLLYNGLTAEPLYSLLPDGTVSDGSKDVMPSFLHEYKYKLEKLYHQFYTARGKEIALIRQPAAVSFYDSFLAEVRAASATKLGLEGKAPEIVEPDSNAPGHTSDTLIKRATVAELASIIEVDPYYRKETISQALSRGECYVVVVDNAVRGFAIMHYHFFENGFVDLLVVAADARRQGLGLALLDYLWAACSAEKLFASTNRSNEPMRKLLAKAGFTYCGSIDALDECDPELFFSKQ